MLLPLLATRFIARNVVASSRLALSRAPALQITRALSVTRVAWASSSPAAAKKATAKKTTTKKTAAKKTATRAAKKKPAKRATKKKPAKKTSIRKPARARKAKAKPKKSTVIPRIPLEHKPPKHPGLAFSVYYKQYRQGRGPQEGETALRANARMMKDAAASWNALSEQEKQPFRDESNAAVEEYKRVFSMYVKHTDPSILRRINKLRVRRGLQRVNFRTHRPTIHGYMLFFQEERPKIQGGDRKRNLEITKEIGNRWSALPDAEKAMYNERAKALKT